ncbi:MAG: TldD/PmbA family protein [Candidatus Bipolaricaulota bacterium]
MLKQFNSVLAAQSVGQADARWEENRRVVITFRGPMLTDCRTYCTTGGHVRCFAGAGKALSSITDPADVEDALGQVTRSAQAMGSRRKHPVKRAQEHAVVGTFHTPTTRDPRQVPLSEKLELLSHYNRLALGITGVVTTRAEYQEWSSKRCFASTGGTSVEYELLLVNIVLRVTARRNGVVQDTAVSFGGSADYERLLGRDDEVRRRAERAVELLSAPQARAGVFPVVLDPDEAGLFIHEAFGHLSEADGIQHNPSFRRRLSLGTQIAAPELSVTDDPRIAELPGTYEVDDEGVPGGRTELIKQGTLVGRLHSRETAADFAEPPSGNMRAVDAFYTPIIRMSNIFIEPGEHEFPDMVAAVEDGYYLVGAKGGQTSGDQFTFGAQYGRRIRNGRLAELVRDVNMSGELFSTLQRVRMVGDDLEFSERGGCGKGSLGPMQLNPKSGKGAPHLLIDQVTVGGTR